MSTDVRNEGQLLCDIIGLESLVDEITFKLASDAMDEPTATAVLGPFWRKDAPRRRMGESIVIKEMSEGDRTVCPSFAGSGIAWSATLTTYSGCMAP
jgi:catechol 1,2-dioxygenase